VECETRSVKVFEVIEKPLTGRYRHPDNVRGCFPGTALNRLQTILEICEAEFGQEVRSAEDITSIPGADKAALYVQFASGLRIKLCIYAAGDRSLEQSDQFLRKIGYAGFPRVLIRGDGWAAIEWIEGDTLSRRRFSQDIMRQAVDLLTAIHIARIKPATGIARKILNEVRLNIKQRLPVLVSNGILSDLQSRRVADLGDSISAGGLEISLIHGDFSPDNLVVQGNKVYSVDNDKMRLHVADYDLCRAVTFWNEWNSSGTRFLKAYASQSSRRLNRESLLFWGTYDLVYRTSYRISALGEFNRYCIMRLSEILRTGVFR
jgi:hypothetical protein